MFQIPPDTAVSCTTPQYTKQVITNENKRETLDINSYQSTLVGIRLCQKDTEEITNRFWKLIMKTPGCWLWQGAKNKNGEGQYSFLNTIMLSRKFSWLLTNNKIPRGYRVYPKCGEKLCVHPQHLFLW